MFGGGKDDDTLRVGNGGLGVGAFEGEMGWADDGVLVKTSMGSSSIFSSRHGRAT
jgi:hypothetical protein